MAELTGQRALELCIWATKREKEISAVAATAKTRKKRELERLVLARVQRAAAAVLAAAAKSAADAAAALSLAAFWRRERERDGPGTTVCMVVKAKNEGRLTSGHPWREREAQTLWLRAYMGPRTAWVARSSGQSVVLGAPRVRTAG